MLGKQIAALSLSGLLLFSGAVTAANADEATPIDTTGYAAAAEVLAGNGVASSAATAMQTGSGLRLAQASGLLDGGETTAINLGTGTGTTVKELVETIRRTTNRPFPVEVVERRPGDAPCLVANNTRAREVLGWTPTRTLDDIVRTAWRWHAAEIERATPELV